MPALATAGPTTSSPNRPRLARTIAAAALAATVGVGGVAGCTATPSSTDIVTLATQQLGKPYQYGAAGPTAFDCSGLVQYVFKQAGRTLPRTAQQQYDASLPITVLQAGKGDLVFYGAPRAVYHVGIYVGDGQMIDAAHIGTMVRQEKVWAGAAYGQPLG